MTISIFIADDHDIIREGIKITLETQTDNIKVCGEAENGIELLEKGLKLSPHLYIIDVEMPEINGIEATKRIIEKNPEAKIILLSMHDKPNLVEKSLESGAKGYLLKGGATKELVNAVREVLAGNVYFSPRIAQYVLNLYLNIKDDAHKKKQPLTKREQQVLLHISEGFSNPEISEKLNIALNTVKIHRKNIMKKLNVHKTADLIKYAIKQGIIIP
ncbi:MAG: response regulator [Candidatus Muiribacteriota bacterium]